ncbi:type II toxin-antitoxin system VapC family toxin [Acidobacteria bacterium AB60]|nr:type II toxin-antitoxin system VapC family toxin [Acidobacteria bacterium AB60]
MPFVLDASVTASWAFPDEQDPVADRAGQLLESSSDNAIVPSLWWFEVRNILLVNERRGRTNVARSAVFLEQLTQLAIQIDHETNSPQIMDLARNHRLTAYDASYLSLAIREHLPLATLDQALRRAATSTGVALLI